MKLTRTEQKKENAALDLFLDFALDFADDYEAGKKPELDDTQRDAFRHVENRLTRYFGQSDVNPKFAVAREFQAVADELKEAKFYGKAIKSATPKLTKDDLRLLREAYRLVTKLREVAKNRAKNLEKGREQLETILESGDEDAERIASVRAQNALEMVEKRHPDAAALGGKIGGKARAEKLSKAERQKIAGKAGSVSKRGKDRKPRKKRAKMSELSDSITDRNTES